MHISIKCAKMKFKKFLHENDPNTIEELEN
jgi:hypothetical protein